MIRALKLTAQAIYLLALLFVAGVFALLVVLIGVPAQLAVEACRRRRKR